MEGGVSGAPGVPVTQGQESVEEQENATTLFLETVGLGVLVAA